MTFSTLKGWKAGSVLVVAIPLNLRKRFILRKFNELLAKRHTRRRGQRTFRESQALYPIAAQFDCHSLKKILDTYDMRQSQPDLTLWEIGDRLALGTKLTREELADFKRPQEERAGGGFIQEACLGTPDHRRGRERDIFPAFSTRS